MRPPAALTSSASPDWFSPPWLAAAARHVMGDIDLDPASCAEANKIVQASEIFTKRDDALKRKWYGNVFLNPPGGRLGRDSLPVLFWDKLVCEYMADRVKSAVFVGFSINILQTTQVYECAATSFPFCVPSKRIKFLQPGRDEPDRPSHVNVIVYLPPRERTEAGVDRFQTVFSKYVGACCNV